MPACFTLANYTPLLVSLRSYTCRVLTGLGITTMSIVAFRIMTLGITTNSITIKNATLSIMIFHNSTRCCYAEVIYALYHLFVIMLIVALVKSDNISSKKFYNIRP